MFYNLHSAHFGILLPRLDMHVSGMPRSPRPYRPGAFFHLTARIHGNVPWFTPQRRTRIVAMLAECAKRTDALLLAYVIMSNHLHIVLRQGTAPLSRLMQPLLRRTALMVQRTEGVEGHIFERPYRHRICGDAAHLRNSIAYVHLNPVRAKLCDSADEYAWSSHHAYRAPRAAAFLAQSVGLGMFACGEQRSEAQLCQDYIRYVRWRKWKDDYDASFLAGLPVGLPPISPPTTGGNLHWHAFTAAFAAEEPDKSIGRGKDLRDLVQMILNSNTPKFDLEDLSGRHRSQPIAALRHEVVLAALRAGYRGTEIARYLRVSPAMVSRVGRRYLWSPEGVSAPM